MDDPAAFLATCKDVPMAAVVEWVRDGSTVKCYLPERNVSVLVQAAGIQCPRLRPQPSRAAINARRRNSII